MSDFSPGLHRAPTGKARRAPYPSGQKAIKASVDTVCTKIVEGRFDLDVQGWGKQVLKKRNLDGRDGVRSAQIMAGILDELRDVTVYVADAYGAEVIQSASATLCLRPGLCIAGGDCDDLCVVLGAVLMALGIRVWLVKQRWTRQQQEHVLIAGEDENGEKIFLDLSTRLPAGSKYPADEVVFYDPMEVVAGKGGMAGPEIVTLGKHPPGLAGPPATPPVPYPTPSGAYADAMTGVNAMAATAWAGDTYAAAGELAQAVGSYQAAGAAGATVVGPQIDLSGAPNTTQPMTQQAWTLNAALAAVNAATPAAADVQTAAGYAQQMLALYQQAIASGQTSVVRKSDPSPGPATSSGKAVAIAVGVGAAVGIAAALYLRSRRQVYVRIPVRRRSAA